MYRKEQKKNYKKRIGPSDQNNAALRSVVENLLLKQNRQSHPPKHDTAGKPSPLYASIVLIPINDPQTPPRIQ